jgi:hypothetical protein
MSALRSVVAVGAGFFATSVLALGGDYALRAAMPEEFAADGSVKGSTVLGVTLIYTAVFGAVGGYVAAWIGQVRPMMHAGIVGAIVLALSAMAAAFLWETVPPWYHIATLVMALPVALIGGKLREMRR